MTQSSGEIIALTAVFTVIAIVAVVLRVVARRIAKQPCLTDDFLAFASLFTFIGTLTVPVILVCADANLGNHVSYTPDGIPKVSHLYTVCLFIIEFATYIPIAFAKLSILFFYKRIFRGPALVAVVWTLVALVVVWCIAFTLGNLLQCLPLDKYLNLPHGSPEVHCIDSLRLFYGGASSDVIMDFVIFLVPVPFVMRLHMKLSRKLAVLTVFATGAVAIAASIARLVEFVYAGNKLDAGARDITYVVAPTVYWKMLEGALAILAVCLPSFGPLFRNKSMESMVNSVRSALSLNSLGGSTHGTKSANATDERQGSLASDAPIEHRLYMGPDEGAVISAIASQNLPIWEGQSKLPYDSIMVERSFEQETYNKS